MPQWMTSCGWRVMFLRLFRARVVVMMSVKMMSLMSVMMMMISYNGVDGDNKRTKVLMIKRSFVWCTFWLAGGIQDRKEFGTRVHEICANHIVLIVMIVVLVVNIMLIVMTILLIHKITFLIIVIKKCENGIENHDRKIPQRKTKFLSVCDELNLKCPARVTFLVGVDCR